MMTDIAGVAKLPFTIRGTRMIACLRRQPLILRGLPHIMWLRPGCLIAREMLVVKGTPEINSCPNERQRKFENEVVN
jgi:hypothetical protein